MLKKIENDYMAGLGFKEIAFKYGVDKGLIRRAIGLNAYKKRSEEGMSKKEFKERYIITL